jgi:hypothetical protein
MQKLIINVKCDGYISPLALRGAERDDDFENIAAGNVNHEGTDEDDPLLRSSYYGRGQSTMVIPLIPEKLWNEEEHPRALLALADIGAVRDRDHSRADLEAALRAAVPEILRRLPRVNTVDGLKHKVQIESTIV